MISTLDLGAADSFLKTCSKEIKKGHCYFVGYRKINVYGKEISAKQALLNIEIMKIDQIWTHVLELKKTDLIKIARDNDHFRDMNSEVYIFLKEINNKMVYIKLTMNEHGIICISFHESY